MSRRNSPQMFLTCPGDWLDHTLEEQCHPMEAVVRAFRVITALAKTNDGVRETAETYECLSSVIITLGTQKDFETLQYLLCGLESALPDGTLSEPV